MNMHERLEDEACKDGIDIISCNFESNRIKGLYHNGVIGINSKVEKSIERGCILAEEMGHHYTSCRKYPGYVRHPQPQAGTAGEALGL